MELIDQTTVSGSPLWRCFREPGWLLSRLLTFCEQDGDEIHGLWLLAIDDELRSLRAYLEQHFAVSVDHARRIAMVHSMWSVLLKLARVGRVARRAKSQRMSETTVKRVLAELDRLQVPSQADRSVVLRTVAWPTICRGPPWHESLHPVWGEEMCFASRQDPCAHSCRDGYQFVLYAAARRGLLESVVWLDEVACYNQRIALECAAQHGHDHVVDWLLDHPHSNISVDSRPQDDPQLGMAAWRERDQFYYTMHKKWGFHASYLHYEPACAAARCGDMDGLRRLLKHELFGELTDAVARSAVASGQCTVLAFLLQHCQHVLTSQSVMSCAIQHRRLEIAQWLVSKGCHTIDEWTLWQAAESEQLEMLQWLLERFDGRAAMEARIASAMVGGRRILEWLEDECGQELTSIPYIKAGVVCRDFELTKRIVTRRIACGSFSADEVPTLFSAAIKAGNVELVRWFVDDLNLWYPDAFYEASIGFSPDTLAFVYESACARRGLVAVGPRVHGSANLDTLEWLFQHGFRSQFFGREALSGFLEDERDYANNKEYLGLHVSNRGIRRLHEVLCLVIDVYDPEYLRQVTWLPKWAARRGKLKSLKRLAEIGHQHVFMRRLFDGLLFQSGSEAVVRWHLEQRPELFTTLVVRWAVTYGKRGVLQWIFETFLPSQGTAVLALTSDQSTVLRKCVHTAIRASAQFERHDVVRKLQQWTPTARDPSLWRGIDETFRAAVEWPDVHI